MPRDKCGRERSARAGAPQSWHERGARAHIPAFDRLFAATPQGCRPLRNQSFTKEFSPMKRVLKIIGIVVVVILLAVIALPFLVNVNSFRPKLESELSTALGRQVKVGNLSLSILSGSVSAEDLSISDDPAFSKGPFIQA